MAKTYEIVSTKEDGLGIRCLICGMTSWNENDVREKYCGNCRQFHAFMEPVNTGLADKIDEMVKDGDLKLEAMKAPEGPYQDTHLSGKKPQEDPQGPKND